MNREESSSLKERTDGSKHEGLNEEVCEHDIRDRQEPKTENNIDCHEGDDQKMMSESPILYYVLLVMVTAASLITRFYKIEQPPWVCWDETHFGKMGSWYINHSFFFDVHPPLGKMLIGLAGYMTGYDGKFPFSKPGDDYGDVKYVGMRMFCASLGAAIVPLAFMSTWLVSRSVMAALFAAVFILFDSGTNTLSRHILLDPILMFFIMVSTFCLLKFLSYRDRSFSLLWWFWLVCTGVALSCSISVKFVGLFVVLLAGYSTAADLWRLLGEKSLSLVDITKHFLARAMCLIAVPLVCYMVIFSIHLNILYKSGNGDGFYSSQFQSQLEGNRLHNVSMPLNIAYGSVMSIKQRRTGGAYLHSHWHLYPEENGPRQQQITTYSHKDFNNFWMVKRALEEPDTDAHPMMVKNGDLVRLEHTLMDLYWSWVPGLPRKLYWPVRVISWDELKVKVFCKANNAITRRNLHSHKERAPVTQRHYQVTGYGQDGIGDANDVWQIVSHDIEDGALVQAVRTKFKLIHYHTRCALYSHDKKLPKWGHEQLEVTCNPDIKSPLTLWSIEEVKDPRLPNVSFEVHAPSFLEKFKESHAIMFQGNSGMKPKEWEVTSRPWQWPINTRGQIFSGRDHRIYLLGNPVIFYGMLVILGMFLVMYFIHAVRRKRGYKLRPEVREYLERTFQACWWLLLGWGLHYLPFWPMTRVLYFHHYFPAFLYSAMFSGVVVNYCINSLHQAVPSSLSHVVYHLCTGLVLSTATYSFYLFHPMTYGMSGPLAREEGSQMHGLKWLDSWEI